MRKKETTLGYTVSLDEYIRSSPNEQDGFLMEMVTESNLIEGIELDPVQTIYEGFSEPDRDGHYEALKYMMENYHEKIIDNNDIKHMHKLMMSYELNNAGQYGKRPIHIGKKGCPHRKHVNKLMNELESKISDEMSYDDIFNIHYMFENIHPFSDGNGRTGRLLLNWLTLRNFNEFNIITADKRKEYFNAINIYEQKFRVEHPKVRFYKDLKEHPNDMRDMRLLYELQKASEKHPFKV